MHLLFLDESGRLDQGGLFALGGIAVRDADWPELGTAGLLGLGVAVGLVLGAAAVALPLRVGARTLRAMEF